MPRSSASKFVNQIIRPFTLIKPSFSIRNSSREKEGRGIANKRRQFPSSEVRPTDYNPTIRTDLQLAFIFQRVCAMQTDQITGNLA